MASPQVENGFVKIANELFDEILKFPFTRNQRKIMDAIIRKTYGFGKKYDRIASSQLEQMTGIKAGNCRTARNQLIAAKCALTLGTPQGQLIGINKDYTQWNSALILGTRLKSRHTINNLIKPSRKKPKTSAPAEFLITPELRAWIREKFGDVPKETIATERDKFLDRNRAEGKAYSNWEAAWKNWMRNWWKWTGREELKPGTHGYEDLNAGTTYHEESDTPRPGC